MKAEATTEQQPLNITHVAMIAALVAVSTFIRVPLPSVPLTFQPFVVLIVPMLFGASAAFYGILVYLVIGLLGVPVFANGGGIMYVLQPTFGYLVGFLLSTLPNGYVSSKVQGFAGHLMGGLLALFVIYLVGVPYLFFNLNGIQGKEIAFMTVMNLGFFMPIPFDLLKLFAAAAIAMQLKGKIASLKKN